MQFLYFLEEGSLNLINEISKEWMIWRKRLHSICFGELPREKQHKKPSAGFRDCSPVPFSKCYDTILHIIMSKINDAAHVSFQEGIFCSFKSSKHQTNLVKWGCLAGGNRDALLAMLVEFTLPSEVAPPLHRSWYLFWTKKHFVGSSIDTIYLY